MNAVRTLLVISAACLFTTANVSAQGRINFNNTSATPLRLPSLDGGAPVTLGTASTALFGFGPASVRIQLFAGLSSTSLSPVLIGSATPQLYVTNTASTLGSAQGTFPGGSAVAFPDFDGSQPVFLQFIATGILPNNSWLFAASPIIQVNLTLSPELPTSVFSTTADGSHWDGLTLIPEPSALSLSGISFALMFLRRRKMR